MKKSITILLLLFGATILFCQTRTGGMGEYRIEVQELPYKATPFSMPDRNGAIWRPLNCYHHVDIKPNAPYNERKYRYDTTGVLKQENVCYYGETWDWCIATCNETFTKEGLDFADTITRFKKQGDRIIPVSRNYYEYHYYDVMPHDSFYYVDYREIWNDETKEWILSQKNYSGFFDTVLFIKRESCTYSYMDGDWIKSSGIRLSREYDENGLVTSQTGCFIFPGENEYELVDKREFFYNEENIHVETHIYNYFGDGSWKLVEKFTDYQYTEWYPTGVGGITVIMVGQPEYLPISGKRVKVKSATAWFMNDNDEWEQFLKYNHEWDINGTNSHIGTEYLIFNDTWYPYLIIGYFYDEQGDFIGDSHEVFISDGTLIKGHKYGFKTCYHPEYDVPESYYKYEWYYRPSSKKWDSLFLDHYEYFNWWDVRYPVSITEPEATNSTALSIFPNPVSGVATISASEEIQQLHIFDITGRLVHSQSPASDRVVFDTGALPAGAYLVRAMTKDGGVQTGKLIITE